MPVSQNITKTKVSTSQVKGGGPSRAGEWGVRGAAPVKSHKHYVDFISATTIFFMPAKGLSGCPSDGHARMPVTESVIKMTRIWNGFPLFSTVLHTRTKRRRYSVRNKCKYNYST